MNLLSGYIAKLYLKFWALSLLAIILLVLAANLFGNIDNVFTSWPRFKEFLGENVEVIPIVLDLAIPITVLLATLFTFSSLGRTSELVALHSLGMGLGRQLRPIFIVVALVAGLDYVNQNYLYRTLGTVAQEEKALSRRQGAKSSRHQWHALNDRVFYSSRVDSSKGAMDHVQVFHWSSGPFRLQGVERIEHIRQAQGQGWIFENVQARWAGEGNWRLETTPREERPGQDFPNLFNRDLLNAHHLPILDLSAEIRQLESGTGRVELYVLEWYQKTAAFCAPFILVWFGTPLAQTHHRRGRASGEILLGILGGLFFLVSSEILFTLGKGGFLHPLIAAWGVNLAFAAFGTLLFWWRRV